MRPPGGESVPRLAVVDRQRPWGSLHCASREFRTWLQRLRKALERDACQATLWALQEVDRTRTKQSNTSHPQGQGVGPEQARPLLRGRLERSSRVFARWPGALPLWAATAPGMQSLSLLTTGQRGPFALGCCGASEAKAPLVAKG